jgi:hypothetical protein
MVQGEGRHECSNVRDQAVHLVGSTVRQGRLAKQEAAKKLKLVISDVGQSNALLQQKHMDHIPRSSHNRLYRPAAVLVSWTAHPGARAIASSTSMGGPTSVTHEP